MVSVFVVLSAGFGAGFRSSAFDGVTAGTASLCAVPDGVVSVFVVLSAGFGAGLRLSAFDGVTAGTASLCAGFAGVSSFFFVPSPECFDEPPPLRWSLGVSTS